jgi:hypothetical protein
VKKHSLEEKKFCFSRTKLMFVERLKPKTHVEKYMYGRKIEHRHTYGKSRKHVSRKKIFLYIKNINKEHLFMEKE